MPGEYVVSSLDGRLVAKFDWNVDRYSHQLLCDEIVVGHSVEGDSAETWPASPPIQQLSLENIYGRQMVLGVGGAGRSHWSLSAAPCTDDENAIRFDLACRCKESPSFLGSSYKFAAQLRLTIIDGEARQEKGTELILAASSEAPTRQWSYRLSAGP